MAEETGFSRKNLAELREECRGRGISAEETASRDELIRRCILFDAGMAQASLPEAGYKRDEELARRADALEERADAAPEVYPIDPKAFEEDREILYDLTIDQLQVTNMQPGYVYCWAYFGQNGQMVWAKKALGWRVVGVGPDAGRDRECEEHKEVDGSRRIGDVLLMKIPEERYNRILKAQERRRLAQQLGVTQDVQDFAEKHGMIIHKDLSTVKVGPHTLADVMTKKAERATAARKVAMKHLDKKIREGTVFGEEAE